MDDKILGKIKKCLALSASPEPHEAAAALRQAQKLMQLHGVSEQQLKLADFAHEHVKSVASVRNLKEWENSLLDLVCKAFGCKAVWTNGWSHDKDPFGHFSLMGRKDQVALAAHTMVVLQRKLVKARAAYVTTLSPSLSRQAKVLRAESFSLGWIYAIRKTVQTFAQPAEELELLKEYQATKFVVLDKAKEVQQRNLYTGALLAGQSAAAGEALHRPMAPQDSFKQLS